MKSNPIRTWNDYAANWKVLRSIVHIEDRGVPETQRDDYLETLGDEWGDKPSVDQFVNDFLVPHCTDRAIAAEIGSGGGRIARRVRPLVEMLYCLDTEPAMLALCEKALAQVRGRSQFVQLGREFPSLPIESSSLDLVYSFDTMVHLHFRYVFGYLREAARVLRLGGTAVFHVATSDTPQGRAHLLQSLSDRTEPGTLGSFEYLGAAALLSCASSLGFVPERVVSGVPGNFYYERDCICSLRKVAEPAL